LAFCRILEFGFFLSALLMALRSFQIKDPQERYCLFGCEGEGFFTAMFFAEVQ